MVWVALPEPIRVCLYHSACSSWTKIPAVELLPVMLQAGPCSSSCHPQMCSRVWHCHSGTLERLHGNHHGAGTRL